MENNQSYPAEINDAIQNFVSRIEAVLMERKLPRSQRNTICDEVESQIHTLIERRLESGATLNLDLINTIIESMDQPESYALPDEPILTEATAPTSEPSTPVEVPVTKATRPSALPKWKAFVPSFVQTYFSKDPRVDWLALAGLGACALGVLCIPVALMFRHGSGPGILFGLLLVFLGTIASAVSFWRIRQSKGKLSGIRYAAIGLLALPFLFINGIVLTMLLGAHLWMLVGGLVTAAMVVYANYRAIRYGLHWLETSSIGQEVTIPEAAPAAPADGQGAESTILNGASL